MTWLLRILRALDCQHARLGLATVKRGDGWYAVCMSCARLVRTDLEELPQIKPPVLSADVDRAARDAQVRTAYLEQLALRGTAAAHRSGLERMRAEPETAELERLWQKS